MKIQGQIELKAEFTEMGISILNAMALNNASRIDPTRSLTLRKNFIADMKRRFKKLRQDIKKSIIDNDCFGIIDNRQAPRILEPIAVGRYAFARTDEKITGFMTWLQEQENAGILETVPYGFGTTREAGPYPWTNTYIQTEYQKSIAQGRANLIKTGYDVPSFAEYPGGIGAVMNQPFNAERLGVLYTRCFEDLKTVMQAANGQMRRQLADGLTTGLTRGMAEGKNPRQIARELVSNITDRLDKIGQTRALTIARTEISRAHHIANVSEFRQAGVEGVTVQAEFMASGLPNMCEECAYLDGKKFTLDEIEPLIPVHPNCRCTILPLAPGGYSKEVAEGEKEYAYTGESIKNKFNVVAKGKVGRAANDAINTIDKVQGDGPLDKIPIRGTQGTRHLGAYRHNSLTKEPIDIYISSKGTTLEFNTCHEIGHFIDHQGLFNKGSWASLQSPVLSEWRKAVDGSASVKELIAYSKGKAVDIGTDIIRKPVMEDPSFVFYALNKKEIFARSFAQYITEKSGSKVLKSQLDESLKSKTYWCLQWEHDDFVSIKKALDNLFRGLGWLK